MQENLKAWLLGIYMISCLAYAAMTMRSLGFFLLALAVLILFAVVEGAIAIFAEKWHRRKYRYWVEIVSPSILRGAEGEFAVVYHDVVEGDLWFTSTDKVRLPTPEDWPFQVPAWAQEQRSVIVPRILKSAGRWCEKS